MLAAETILVLALIYLACGLAFAIAFVTRGIGRLDHAARDTSLAFRLILVPAGTALWPLLAYRWIRATHQDGKP